ncbi:MAG: hypothetical protein JWL95_527 [Gemmatimonadetes bacterium]|nr:hypothetical protein [Gemmatimonadota bacterium]
MTAAERVRGARRALGAGVIARALAWGVAAAFGARAAIVYAALAMPHADRDWRVVPPVLAGLIVSGSLLWRARHVWSASRVALWVEEQLPALQYALVTTLEQGRTLPAAGIESLIARHDIGGVSRNAATRAVLPALVAATLAALLMYAAPTASRIGPRNARGDAGPPPGGARSAGSRVAQLVVQVTPPAYTRAPSSTLTDPSSVAALVGSRVVVRGRGDAPGVEGTLVGATISATPAENGWSVAVVMPATPAALTLRDRGDERIIVLTPRADDAPRVVLTSPQRDSTLRLARLMLRLSASASDDIGLSNGHFEYLVSTGSDELFTARTLTSPVTRFGGAERGSLSASLDLASLGLKQGDVVSIRAVVEDGNTLGGPGLATSDTRTFRIARAGEYDSVAVDGAGPTAGDSSALSQRMLIAMTEKLVREQRSLARVERTRRATEIAAMEDRIRSRVHDILYAAEAHADDVGADSAGPAATEAPADDESRLRNPNLAEAYDALWEAVRSLRIAEPAPALPPMRRAAAALDRARVANRLYLRGTPPTVVVDLARVRMTGKEKGIGSVRTPRAPEDLSRARLTVSFGEALALIPARPAAAVRQFTLLQADALAIAPSFASALGDAVDAMRRGRDPAPALQRARRMLTGAPESAPGLTNWSGGW